MKYIKTFESFFGMKRTPLSEFGLEVFEENELYGVRYIDTKEVLIEAAYKHIDDYTLGNEHLLNTLEQNGDKAQIYLLSYLPETDDEATEDEQED